MAFRAAMQEMMGGMFKEVEKKIENPKLTPFREYHRQLDEMLKNNSEEYEKEIGGTKYKIERDTQFNTINLVMKNEDADLPAGFMRMGENVNMLAYVVSETPKKSSIYGENRVTGEKKAVTEGLDKGYWYEGMLKLNEILLRVNGREGEGKTDLVE